MVLLIAVMFTFSFGSAFAAVPDADARLIEQAGDYAKSIAADTYAKAYAVVLDKTGATNAYITESAWAAAAADAEKVIADNIDAAVTAYIAETATPVSGWKAYPSDLAYTAKKLFDYADYTTMAGYLDQDANPIAVAAAKAQFALDIEKSLAKYDAVDMNLYSATEKDTNGETYYDNAEALVKGSKEKINGIFYAANGDYIYGRTLVSQFKGDAEWVEAKIELGDATGIAKLTKQYWDDAKTLFKDTYAIGTITTVAELEVQDAIDAATVAAAKAQIAANVANFLKDNTAAADKAFAADYTEVYGFLAEVAPSTVASVVAGHAVGNMEYIQANFALGAVVDKIEKLEAAADRYAAEKDENGKLVRDAEDIAKAVKKATVYEYANAANLGGIYTTAYPTAAAFDAAAADAYIKALSVDLDAAYLAFQKDAKKAELADKLEDLEDDYYDLEYAAVVAEYEAAYTAIDAAADADEITDAVNALNKKVAPILEDSEVEGLFNGTAMSTELNKQTDALRNYVENYLNYSVAGYKDAHVVNGTATDGADSGRTAALAEIVRDYYIENNARTAAEMKAMTDVVTAVAETLPTVGELDAAKKAAEAAVKALPAQAKVTVADKDAIVAAFQLVEDYTDLCEIAGVAPETAKMNMTGAVAGLKTALNNETQLAYVKADKNDKAALRAIASSVSALKAELVEEVGIFAANDLVNPTVDALKKIQEAELKAVEKAINAIPINVTEADAAIVKAAREAYDAYVADWTNVDRTDLAGTYNYNGGDYMDGFALADADNVKELLLAEASLGLNEDPAADVEALKITASSKAAKGSITVKWSVKGETENVDGYEIWRSTKKNSGFKKMFTTTKTSYKNTKNLKKGTRYYFKVRAYANIDGVKYTSDWSNKAYRVAK